MAWLTVAVAGAWLGASGVDPGNPRVRVVEKDGVRVRVSIQAHDYTVQVTNLDVPPITRFEMGQWNAYNFEGPEQPEKWDVDYDRHWFYSWTEDEGSAIRQAETKSFSLRAGSKGAVLGLVPVKLGFASGESVVIPDCWGPVPEPSRTVLAVPIMVLAIVVGHTVLVARRQRKAAAAASA